MNRIYQGRVKRLEILSSAQTPEVVASCDGNALQNQVNNPLWTHHCIFQDAINYYLIALAALADPEHVGEDDRLIKDLRARVKASWDRFPRSTTGKARGLRESLCAWLALKPDATFEDACKVILDGNEAEPTIKPAISALALALLLEKCGGESRIQQGGRDYLPRFCDKKAKPTYDFDAKTMSTEAGKKRLAEILHGNPVATTLDAIAAEMELGWTVKIQPGKTYSHQDSRKRLQEAIKHLQAMLEKPANARIQDVAKKFPNFNETLQGFEARIPKLPEDLEIPRNRKANRDLTFATLAFKYFPHPLTASILALFLAKPNKAKTTKPSNVPDFAAFGDDPIKLARGNRGYVFTAFTALPAWRPLSPGQPIWKEFDIAAFKEALKTLNQFNQKTQEREEKRRNLEGRLAILLGKPIQGWEAPRTEAGEEEKSPEPLHPEHFRLARQLEAQLTSDLAEQVLGESKTHHFGEAQYQCRSGEWQLSRAALRGFREIAEDWNKVYAKYDGKPSKEQLEKVVKDYQREEKNKKSVGSLPLFLTLCEEDYWPLWLGESTDREKGEAQPFNTFLYEMVNFHQTVRDWERCCEEINLTPAEPTHSRRLYMFSDLNDKGAKVRFTKSEDGENVVECALALPNDEGVIKEQRVRLFYSAPRLLRDELLSSEPRWLQPMMKGLGVEAPAPETSAVSLMPDQTGGKKGQPKHLRMLLNFPIKLDADWLHSAIGKSHRWKNQFNGTRDKHLHLHWPKTAKTDAAKKNPWWKKPEIIDRGFTALSVDLGQRSAGAWALLSITCWDPRCNNTGTKKPVREIGSDGERRWWAEIIRTGVFRLPGEDQKVQHADGTFCREPFGKAGRKATASEYHHALEIAKALLADQPENWVGKDRTDRSYPEQNDGLIALATRRLSRLNTFHRWSCFNPDREEVAHRRDSLIQKLLDELEHWNDETVKTWKAFVEAGNWDAFRKAAGQAFVELRDELSDQLVMLANRAAPLRDRSWEWKVREGLKKEEPRYHELTDTGPQLGEAKTWIRGQRGLSMQRLEQLENLRRLFLRHNRSFDREPGQKASFGHEDRGRASGEPCQGLLEKIERIKEQRINQTAHLILAEALGVRLKSHDISEDERKRRDIHGEYERIPGRTPVDFIVIENLDRYLTSQGRSPQENSRLMKWAHRAVRDKIKMLAEEPFGMPVVETAAAYSSRFCYRTGVAGARLEERAGLDDHLRTLLKRLTDRPPKSGQPEPKHFAYLSDQFARLEQLNARHVTGANANSEETSPLKTLFLPKAGGPLFLAFDEGGPVQADCNAAINLGLRAVAAPESLHILHKIRTERSGDSIRPKTKTKRENAVFNKNSQINLEDASSSKLQKSRSPNFFIHYGPLASFDRGRLPLAETNYPVASGVALWASINTRIVKQIVHLNEKRLSDWNAPPLYESGATEEDEDDIPM